MFITGGDGFIGRNLQDMVDCYVYDLQREGDIREPIEAPSYSKVVHLAAISGFKMCSEKPNLAIDTNIRGTLNVLDYARRNDSSVVFASTCGVYGNKTIYTQTKLVGEHLCRIYSGIFGLDVSVLRLFNVYGPHSEYEISVIPTFIREGEKGGVLTVEGSGEQTRDFIHVVDVCRAIFASLECRGFNIFDVRTGEETSINELVELMLPDSEIEYISMPSWRGGQGGSHKNVEDSEGEIWETLGLKRPIDLGSGLKRLI